MESVPEAAMEGVPSAERLHEMGFASGPSQASLAHDQVPPLALLVLSINGIQGMTWCSMFRELPKSLWVDIE